MDDKNNINNIYIDDENQHQFLSHNGYDYDYDYDDDNNNNNKKRRNDFGLHDTQLEDLIKLTNIPALANLRISEEQRKQLMLWLRHGPKFQTPDWNKITSKFYRQIDPIIMNPNELNDFYNSKVGINYFMNTLSWRLTPDKIPDPDSSKIHEDFISQRAEYLTSQVMLGLSNLSEIEKYIDTKDIHKNRSKLLADITKALEKKYYNDDVFTKDMIYWKWYHNNNIEDLEIIDDTQKLLDSLKNHDNKYKYSVLKRMILVINLNSSLKDAITERLNDKMSEWDYGALAIDRESVLRNARHWIVHILAFPLYIVYHLTVQKPIERFYDILRILKDPKVSINVKLDKIEELTRDIDAINFSKYPWNMMSQADYHRMQLLHTYLREQSEQHFGKVMSDHAHSLRGLGLVAFLHGFGSIGAVYTAIAGQDYNIILNTIDKSKEPNSEDIYSSKVVDTRSEQWLNEISRHNKNYDDDFMWKMQYGDVDDRLAKEKNLAKILNIDYLRPLVSSLEHLSYDLSTLYTERNLTILKEMASKLLQKTPNIGHVVWQCVDDMEKMYANNINTLKVLYQNIAESDDVTDDTYKLIIETHKSELMGWIDSLNAKINGVIAAHASSVKVKIHDISRLFALFISTECSIYGNEDNKGDVSINHSLTGETFDDGIILKQQLEAILSSFNPKIPSMINLNDVIKLFDKKLHVEQGREGTVRYAGAYEEFFKIFEKYYNEQDDEHRKTAKDSIDGMRASCERYMKDYENMKKKNVVVAQQGFDPNYITSLACNLRSPYSSYYADQSRRGHNVSHSMPDTSNPSFPTEHSDVNNNTNQTTEQSVNPNQFVAQQIDTGNLMTPNALSNPLKQVLHYNQFNDLIQSHNRNPIYNAKTANDIISMNNNMISEQLKNITSSHYDHHLKDGSKETKTKNMQKISSGNERMEPGKNTGNPIKFEVDFNPGWNLSSSTLASLAQNPKVKLPNNAMKKLESLNKNKTMVSNANMKNKSNHVQFRDKVMNRKDFQDIKGR